MRIPWSAPPTVSDATKLGLVPIRANGSYFTTGQRIYELLHQPVVQNDAAWSAFTEVDSGGKVNIDGAGVVTLDGNGAWAANGLYHTAGIARAVGVHQIKSLVPWSSGTAQSVPFQINSAAALINGYSTIFSYWLQAITDQRAYVTSQLSSHATTVSTWYTIQVYVIPDGTAWKRTRFTIQGGTEYPNETVVGEVFGTVAWPATMYPCFQRAGNDGTRLLNVKEYAWCSGFATDGPTLTYVADAGAGKAFNGLVFANLASTGAWLTTNTKFQYSFDDGTPAYNGSWLTLAQLNGTAALTTTKRYIRLQVQVNSDGATQQYAGEINADDATAAAFALPEAGKIATGTTINTVAGTRTDAAEANVLTGSGAYGDPGSPLTPAYSPDFPSVANVIEGDTTDGQPGVYHEALAAEVEDGVTFGPNSSYTGTLAGGGAPSGVFSIILDKPVYAIGQTATVTGGITLDQNVTGATVTLTRKKKSDGSTVATLINESVDFTATVQKTWAAILGAACTFAPTAAQAEYLEAAITGGTPEVLAETSGQATYDVVPASGPVLAVARLTATSVRATISGATTGATVRVYHCLRTTAPSAWSWTLGGSRTGDGTVDITVTAGADNYYIAVQEGGYARTLASNITSLLAGAAATTTPLRYPWSPRKLEGPSVKQDSRDETLYLFKYAIGNKQTLADVNLEFGDTIPGDSSYEILESRIELEPGTAEPRVLVTARKFRAWVS